MSPSRSDPAEQAAARLGQWEDVGRRLWPYVRFWGLCGADPEAITAAVDLANLLGLDNVAQEAAQQAAEMGRMMGRREVVAEAMLRLRKSGIVHRIGPKLLGEVELALEAVAEGPAGGE